MKKKGMAYTAVGILLASLLTTTEMTYPTTVVHATESTVIKLDPSIANGSISPYLYGANHIYIDNGNGMWDPVNKKAVDSFDTAFQQSGISMVRFPGGTIGNTFHWKEAIGPVANRLPQVVFEGSRPRTPDYGVDEALTYMTSRNIQTIYVYNWANGDVADAADLVEYLNAPNDGSNPNGGTDWAAIRAQNGHPEPYHVHYFEIGNEVGNHEQKYWSEGVPVDPTTGQPYTDKTQAPSESALYAFGGTVAFTKQPVVDYSDWRHVSGGVDTSKSNGNANLVKYANYTPVLPGTDSVYVGGQKWNKVADLTQAGQANVYTFDSATGKITFGDGVHGNIPPSGQVISLSYQTKHDGFVDYQKAMRAVDPSILIYSGDQRTPFINAMGSTHPYDGLVQHLYTYGIPDGLSQDDYHDRLMADLDKLNKTLLDEKNQMQSAVSPEQAAKMDVIPTEYGIIGVNSPQGAKYDSSLDAAVHTAAIIMDAMDAHSSIALRHRLTDVVPPLSSGGIFGINLTTGTTFDTPFVSVYKMFTRMFGSELIQGTITGNPIRQIANGAELRMLQFDASRDSSGNVYLAVANKDRATDVATTIDIGHYTTNGNAAVWTLNSDNYYDYNDDAHPNKVSIQTSDISASPTFNYTFPAHSLTFIKIPGNVDIASRDMALHYNLNETTGATATDSSGNGLNGTLMNGPTWTPDGALGGALSFDGVDDSVDTPFVLNPGTTPDFSVSARVKVNEGSKGSSQTLLRQLGGGGIWLYRDAKTGTLKSHLGGSLSSMSSTTTLDVGKWYQVGLVVHNGMGSLYVDGKLEASGTVSPGSHTEGLRIGSHRNDPSGTDNSLNLGDLKNPGSANGEWNGSIDDVRIYKWALNDSDMIGLAREQQPTAAWKLDDGTGTSASDSSGNQLNATLTNGAAWTLDGKTGGAVHFDGMDDAINTPFVLDPGTVSGFSASAWVKLDAVAGSTQVILQQLGNGVTWLYRDSKTGILRSVVSGNTSSMTTIDAGKWYQVGITFDNETGLGRLYVNGKLESTAFTTPKSDAQDGMRIGQHKNPDDRNKEWNGTIDDVRIYNTVLTDQQMADLYQGT